MSINSLNCTDNFANTGIGKCSFIPKHIVGEFIVPDDFELDADGAKSIKEQLQEAAENDNPAERIYPIHNFVEVEDNSDDPSESTFGYGGISINNEGNYDLQFRFMKGGLCLSNQLRQYNNSSVRVIFIDADGVIFGQRVDDKLKGVPLELFYVPKFTISDGDSEQAGFHVRNVFKPKYINEQIAFIDTQALGFDPEEIKGLQEVRLVDAGSDDTSVKLKPLAGCGGLNLAQVYESELADDTLWTLTDASDGSNVSISSADVTDGVVTLTGDSTLPSKTTVKLAKVSDLVSAGIIGYEAKANTFKTE